MSKIEILPSPEVTEVKHFRLEKDGTRYEVMAFKLKGTVTFASLGTATDGWLIITHPNRRAYLLQPTGYLDESYIYEKLCKQAYPLSWKDAENLTQLIRETTGRK
jgi:hypothetical protein